MTDFKEYQPVNYLTTIALCNSNLHGATIIGRIMEVFELWRFNSIISASKGQKIKLGLRRARIIEVRIKEILLYREIFDPGKKRGKLLS